MMLYFIGKSLSNPWCLWRRGRRLRKVNAAIPGTNFHDLALVHGIVANLAPFSRGRLIFICIVLVVVNLCCDMHC
jgi:hypothetical protein